MGPPKSSPITISLITLLLSLSPPPPPPPPTTQPSSSKAAPTRNSQIPPTSKPSKPSSPPSHPNPPPPNSTKPPPATPPPPLNGCYLRYEIAGFRQANPTDLAYKICGSNRASGTEFGDRLDVALSEIEKGMASGTGGYESVYVLAQCEGGLTGGDCLNCVKTAAERAKSDYGSSISAQIYLEQCYISYTYYPNGVPANPQADSSSSGRGKNTQKTVAIVMGVLVGMGLVAACLLFTKSVFKKKSYTYKYGG